MFSEVLLNEFYINKSTTIVANYNNERGDADYKCLSFNS